MNSSICSADRVTHLRFIALALIAALVVALVCARISIVNSAAFNADPSLPSPALQIQLRLAPFETPALTSTPHRRIELA